MSPESGGICGRLTSDLPLGCLQGAWTSLMTLWRPASVRLQKMPIVPRDRVEWSSRDRSHSPSPCERASTSPTWDYSRPAFRPSAGELRVSESRACGLNLGSARSPQSRAQCCSWACVRDWHSGGGIIGEKTRLRTSVHFSTLHAGGQRGSLEESVRCFGSNLGGDDVAQLVESREDRVVNLRLERIVVHPLP